MPVEYVVLIPLQKTSTLNIVSIERRNTVNLTDPNILHVGSGRNVDFIIYKNAQPGMLNSMKTINTNRKLLMNIILSNVLF
jgi:hypothetical protein